MSTAHKKPNFIIQNVVRPLWALKEVQNIDIESTEAIELCRSLLNKKQFLRRIYLDYYASFRQNAKELENVPGSLLEIGSGGGFLKEILPDVITSEVCSHPLIDRVVSADQLNFPSGALKGIFMLHVLHHLASPKLFFQEAVRCLAPGGRLVMIEPFNSFWGRILYKKFHHEPFDESVRSWDIPAYGRLQTANGAIPWVIFWRDRDQFEKQFPQLKIRSIHLHTVFGYALSGGLSWKSLVPGFSYPVFRALDQFLSRYSTLFPVSQTIVIERV